jgi:hypothetical protein
MFRLLDRRLGNKSFPIERKQAIPEFNLLLIFNINVGITTYLPVIYHHTNVHKNTAR